ncbi:MAG: hypothetical protein JNM76_03800 [Betaproteobacteria bacterium]|nr:hypothetical protein [Betaproteobacteria bacterium]
MFKFFLGNALLALGLMSYAQYRGWSITPSSASEFQRQKQDAVYRASNPYSGSGGSGGGFSGK